MDFQQSQRYVRPPPPPPLPLPPMSSDPVHQRQPVPPPGPWYTGQFHYQPPSQHSPPPPHHQQPWAPPPPPSSDHFAPPHPYPAHHFHSHYPPSQPHRPHIPPSYPPHPQDWGHTNWGHHQGWEYPARQGEEDWAAKARAWAASKATSDNQHPQPQFTPLSRLEGQSHYHDQYQQNVQPSNSALGYHQIPATGQKPTFLHSQEYTINSGHSSFVPDEHVAYSARDGSLSGDSNVVYPHQDSSTASSLFHMQEVPSSYSSVTGNVETGEQREKSYRSFPLPADSSQAAFHVPPPPPAVDRLVSLEQPYYDVVNQAAETPVDLSDQPLNFARRFTYDHEPVIQERYSVSGGPAHGADPLTAAPLSHTWTSPPLHDTAYPPAPLVHPDAQQHDPPAVPPLFGRMSGSSFQPPNSSVGPPFGVASGLHPTSAFAGDVYGIPDRPKKASVPNWLKEEIIKNKAIIANSGPTGLPDSVEDEATDRTSGRADQSDSKSVDSPRSTEEDEDEDYVEATRTVAVNQEIKRILTEVLLKVTDELFDEIATQVLEEDDINIQAAQDVAPARQLSFSGPAVPIPKASAKVLVSGKAKEVKAEDDIKKSNSSSAGDLLGLASYASDSDEDNNDMVQHQPVASQISEDKSMAENGNSLVVSEGHSKGQGNENKYRSKVVPNGSEIHNDAIFDDSSEHRASGGSFDGNGGKRDSSNVSEAVADECNLDGGKTVEVPVTSQMNHSAGEKINKIGSTENFNAKKSVVDDSQGRETWNKQDIRDDSSETRKSPIANDIVKDGGSDRRGSKEDESHRIRDKRYATKERTNERNNGSKERMKEQEGMSRKKSKESDSRKRSIDPDEEEDNKEKYRERRAKGKEDNDRRRDLKKDEKGERSRDKRGSESSRYKRPRSPSVGRKGRGGKGSASHSSDDSSDDSRRKLHMRRRNLSPSPSRSRRRQDSRSPPSKHSHRRHSPFSSLETSRGRSSRSRSLTRRHR